MALTLTDLPLEILENVCQMLCPHCLGTTDKIRRQHSAWNMAHLRALSSLSQTCSLLRTIAQPILHHSPLVGTAGSFSLALALCKRPDLGARVRELRVGSEMYSQRDYTITEDESEYLTKHLAEFSESRGTPIQVLPKWWLESRHRDPQGRDQIFCLHSSLALSSLAMSHAPNVKFLDVQIAWENPTHFPFTPPGSMPRLKELTIAYAGRHMNTNLKRSFVGMADIFLQAASNLTSFKAKNWLIRGIPDTVTFDHLEELHLRRCRIGRSTLEELMQKAKKLRVFSYTPGADFLDTFDDAPPKEVFQAILHRADTLQQVKVDFTLAPDVIARCGGDSSLYCMESIRDLRVLEALVVETSTIRFGPGEGVYPRETITDLLPVSIRSLKIVHSPTGLDSALCHLAANVPVRFKDMRTIYLTGRHGQVQTAFQAVGVKTFVLKEEPSQAPFAMYV
ncbi:hypothetical protein V2G26_003800 [Clonostachys chloroleuca]